MSFRGLWSSAVRFLSRYWSSVWETCKSVSKSQSGYLPSYHSFQSSWCVRIGDFILMCDARAFNWLQVGARCVDPCWLWSAVNRVLKLLGLLTIYLWEGISSPSTIQKQNGEKFISLVSLKGAVILQGLIYHLRYDVNRCWHHPRMGRRQSLSWANFSVEKSANIGLYPLTVGLASFRSIGGFMTVDEETVFASSLSTAFAVRLGSRPSVFNRADVTGDLSVPEAIMRQQSVCQMQSTRRWYALCCWCHR